MVTLGPDQDGTVRFGAVDPLVSHCQQGPRAAQPPHLRILAARRGIFWLTRVAALALAVLLASARSLRGWRAESQVYPRNTRSGVARLASSLTADGAPI